MRILVVSTWLPSPPDNGSRVRALHLLQHLSRRHTLTLLSFGARPRAGDLAPVEALCSRVELVSPVTPPAGRLGRRGLFSRVPRHFVQTESPAMHALVETHLRGHDAAVGLQADAARYLGTRPDVARVFEEVEVTLFRERYSRERRRLPRWRHGLTWWKYRHFIRTLVNRFERATVVSEPERDHLRAIGCDIQRVAVIPNGIEVPALETPRVRADRLIYAGPVTYWANLDAVRYFVNEVLPLIRRSRPDVTFCVTGSADGVDVDDLATRPGVCFTGRLPDVDRLVAESAACVVPLRVGGGTRLKVLQAMALGTPVVSTAKGVEGLDVEPERHVLVGETPPALAQQVMRVLNDDALARRLAAEARRLVGERYAWGPIGDALERVIEDAVEQHAARHDARASATGA